MASFYKQGDIAEKKHVKMHEQQGSRGVRGDITERLQDILNPDTTDYAEAVQFVEDGIVESDGGGNVAILKHLFGEENGEFDLKKWDEFVADFSHLRDIYYDTIDDEEQRMSPAQWERSQERVRFNGYLQKILEAAPPMLRVSPSLEHH